MARTFFKLWAHERSAPLAAVALALLVGCGRSETSIADRNDAPERMPLGGTDVEHADGSQLRPISPPRLIELTHFEEREMAPLGPSLGPQFVREPAGHDDFDNSIGGEFTIVDESGTVETESLAAAEQPRAWRQGDTGPRDGRLAAASPSDRGTRLPWGPSNPSTEMNAVAARAEETTRRGFEIAQRGGLYSAKVKFTESLRILAEALDAQRNTTAHTKALSAGLRALEEVDDFVPRGAQIESSINLPLIVDAHRTPVLKQQPLDAITPLMAQRMYLTYAQEQLSAAGGDQPVASLALHGLGKICTAPAQMHGPKEQIAEAKAIVYFQAAVLIEPRNFMAANELGVSLTKFGRLYEARASLEQAAVQSQSPATWRNLAVVNQRLGELDKAAICRDKAEHLRLAAAAPAPGASSSQHPVRWVDVETFAQSNSSTPAMPSTRDAQSVLVQPQANAAPPATAKPDIKTSSRKWPWQ